MKKINDECDCKIKCHFCGACAHMYKCDCRLYRLKFIVCPHIHICHINEQSDEEEKENSIPDFVPDTPEELIQSEQEEIIEPNSIFLIT